MYLNDSLIRNARPGRRLRSFPMGTGYTCCSSRPGLGGGGCGTASTERRKPYRIYPEVSLKQARQKREEIRSKVANGVDPGKERKAERRALEITFEGMALEWLEKRKRLWSEAYAAATLLRLKRTCFRCSAASR
jgi:hypothetical protein